MKKVIGRTLICAVLVLSICANAFLLIRGGYWDKVQYRYFGKERSNVSGSDSSVAGWMRSLEQLDYDADVVFFGDSITSQGKWQEWFPDYKVVNLGVPGNALDDMDERIEMVYAVHPEKVFIMGGINGITVVSLEPYIERYAKIIDELQENLPEAEIYIQSVLPISAEKGQKYNISNETIQSFNEKLEKLAAERGCAYIELYDIYALDGVMNPEMTRDGVHLKEEAYSPWVDRLKDYLK